MRYFGTLIIEGFPHLWGRVEEGLRGLEIESVAKFAQFERAPQTPGALELDGVAALDAIKIAVEIFARDDGEVGLKLFIIRGLLFRLS